jgi:farnesyl-diphosphate farnesyltransferase
MAPLPEPQLFALLERVSRTFYRTLRFLPAAVRRQIGLAYLLARATDTIADTGLVPPEQRLSALESLRNRILGTESAPLQFAELAAHQGSPAERELLDEIEAILAHLDGFSAEDRDEVRQVLDTITSGQELDLRRFGEGTADRILALESLADLDDYTYRVAGCVGEFWSRMCRRHLFPRRALDDDAWLAKGVRFGKGLQLVNILRDLPADLRQGRCYIPVRSLQGLGLRPADLLDPAAEPRFRPLYRQLLDTARHHLRAGWEYTLMLPPGQARVRLACSWPILIGQATLARLRQENVLDASRRIKISRSDVRRLVARSVLCYPFPPLWRKLGDVSYE